MGAGFNRINDLTIIQATQVCTFVKAIEKFTVLCLNVFKIVSRKNL